MIHNIALRLDYIDENTLKILSQLLVDEKFQKYIISKEISGITKKTHYHVYACIESDTTYKNINNKLRTNFKKVIECAPYQYCIQKCKDVNKYLVYMLKDLNIMDSYGFDDSELKTILLTTKQINHEKGKKMKLQLVEHIFNYTELTCYREIMKEIIVYHVDRDYLPPTPTLLLQYTIYVMTKLKLDTRELYQAKLNI